MKIIFGFRNKVFEEFEVFEESEVFKRLKSLESLSPPRLVALRLVAHRLLTSLLIRN
jgi:hypothetical protein